MMAAAIPSPAPDLGDALRRVAATLAAPLPTVFVQYRPPCPVAVSEILDADADAVIRSICRTLERGPGSLAFDPTTRTSKGAEDLTGHQVWVCDHAEQRLARVTGIPVTWLRIAADGLARRGWTPGRNREPAEARS